MVLVGFFCQISPTQAAEAWMTNYQEALAKAKAENKQVFLDFTGSDWCGWCMKLNEEVFSTASFKRYADRNLILVEVDFPRNKVQTDEIKKQNRELQDKFGIRGYPTIIILNSSGEKIGQLGYMPGGPGAFLRELQKMK